MQPYYADDLVTLYHGDWRDLLRGSPRLSLPEGLEAWSFTVTDPPYGTGGWRRHQSGQGGNPGGALVREAWDDGNLAWLPVCAGGDVRPVISFYPTAAAAALLHTALGAGLTKHRAVYMRKLDPKPLPRGRTRWSVEPVWILSGEGFTLQGGTDILDTSTPRLGRPGPDMREANSHPYQKPVRFVQWLLAKLPEGTVLDPFAGSGTTLEAAKRDGRPAIGIELEERWCEVAAQRLHQGALRY